MSLLYFHPGRAGEDYESLVASYQTLLPLRKKSTLDDPALARDILFRTESVLGEINRLLTEAAVYAIEQGIEKINDTVLNKITYHSPSHRRQLYEQLLK